MKMYVFEGTPEEISKVVQTMQPMAPINIGTGEAVQDAPPTTMPLKSADGPDKFVTTEFARRVLARRPLSAPMKAVLRALYEANFEWVPAADLYNVSEYTVAQFSGLMGAFGRRTAHTPGFDGDAHFFDFQWNDEASAWEYRLPATVRTALEAERLV